MKKLNWGKPYVDQSKPDGRHFITQDGSLFDQNGNLLAEDANKYKHKQSSDEVAMHTEKRGDMFICKLCNEEFESETKMQSHFKMKHSANFLSKKEKAEIEKQELKQPESVNEETPVEEQ